MTLTTLIILNVVLGAAVAYGLHHLLGYGIHSDRLHHRQVVGERPAEESERLAA